MRNIFLWLVTMMLVLGNMSCSKTGIVPPYPNSVAINLVNAMPSSIPFIALVGKDTADKYFTYLVNYGIQTPYGSSSSNPLSTIGGVNPLRVVSFKDTTSFYFKGTLNLEIGSIYSFFLAGDKAKPDTLLVKDDLPVFVDSSAGIRFVNTVIGGKSVSVNLLSDSAHPIITNLGYLQGSDFRKFTADSKVTDGSYTFEIRDPITGTLLGACVWYFRPFRCNTVLISGYTDPANGTFDIFLLNNFYDI